MKLQVETNINGSREKVWSVITNIEGSAERISGIEEVEVLERPEYGLVGFKWKETRTMFGKTATEVMWITEAEENSHYNVRAESHGMIYKSVIAIKQNGDQTILSMEFGGEAQNFGTKLMSVLMGPFFKGATRKALQKDLDDIKTWVENN